MKRIIFIQLSASLLLFSCSSHKHVLNCPHYDNFPTAHSVENQTHTVPSGQYLISNPLDEETYPVSSNLNSSLPELNSIALKTEIKPIATKPTMSSVVAKERSEQVVYIENINETLSKKELKKEFKKEIKVQKSTAQGNPRGLAIASLVIGIASLFVAGIPLGILAVVFGAISMGKLEKGNGRGMAVAGLVLGIIGILGAVLLLAGAFA